MKKFQETFKRYEKKYMLTEKKYRQLRQKLKDNLNVDKFGKVSICNIYFDTPDFRLIRKSLEKPIYKEKLRIRSYGTPREGDMIFIELKKKYDGIVYKRREKMELSKVENYLYNREPAEYSTQITSEIDWVLKFYDKIAPAMYLSYNRIAMYGVKDSELRVTFDSNITYRTTDLHLEEGVWGEQLIDEGYRLMEIKIPGSMPLWLSHILDELEIYPCSFSKYGKGYEQTEKLKINKRIEGEKKYA